MKLFHGARWSLAEPACLSRWKAFKTNATSCSFASSPLVNRGNLFSVGDYSLAATFSGRNVISDADVDAVLDIRNRDLLQAAVSTFFDESTPVKAETDGEPEDPATADLVSVRRGFAPFTYYEAIDSIANARETDFFRFNTLGLPRGSFANISIRPLRNGTLVPQTFLLDDQGNSLAMQTLVNGNGELVVQANLVSGQQYAIGVRADDGLPRFQKGDYRLLLYFTDDPVVMTDFASGVVNDGANANDGEVEQSAHNLHVGQSQLFHFSLTAGGRSRYCSNDYKWCRGVFPKRKRRYRSSTVDADGKDSHDSQRVPDTWNVFSAGFPVSADSIEIG